MTDPIPSPALFRTALAGIEAWRVLCGVPVDPTDDPSEVAAKTATATAAIKLWAWDSTDDPAELIEDLPACYVSTPGVTRARAGRGEGSWECPLVAVFVLALTFSTGKTKPGDICEAALQAVAGIMQALEISANVYDVGEYEITPPHISEREAAQVYVALSVAMTAPIMR